MSLVACPLTLVVLDRVALRPPIRPPLSTRARRIARTMAWHGDIAVVISIIHVEKGQRESIEVAIFPEMDRVRTLYYRNFHPFNS